MMPVLVPVFAADAPASLPGWLLQVGALLTSGVVVQFIIFLIKKKGELKALDRTSAAPLLEAQGEFVDRLVIENAKAVARVQELEDKMASLVTQWEEKLQHSEEERRRIVGQLVSVRADLDIALAQIEQQRRQLANLIRPTSHRAE